MTYLIETSLVHLLHRASQVATDLFAKEQAADGLTSRQLVVLAAIAENEGLSQANIVASTGIDRSTLADVARRLLKGGLIARKRTRDDARAYSIKLTSEGQSHLHGAGLAAMRMQDKLLSHFSENESSELIRLLQIIASFTSASVNARDKIPQ